MGSNWLNPSAIFEGKITGKFEEHSMHIHKQIFLPDIPYSWPLREPTMSRIIIETALGKKK